MPLKEARATLALALPIVGTQLAQIAIHTTDVLLLARLGETSLGAGALAFSLHGFLWVVAIGFAAAVSALCAQELGRDRADREAVRRVVHDGLVATLAICAVGSVVLWFGGPLLAALGQPPALVAEAGPLLAALAPGFLASIWFVALRGFCAALERPRPALAIMAGAVVVNAGLNWALMFGAFGVEGLGSIGAGIGSTLVSWGALAALGLFIARDARLSAYRIAAGWWRSTRARLLAYARIAAPIAATFGAEVGLFTVAALVMGRLGAAEVAAHQVALQWAAISFMVPMGVAQATTVRVGLAAGAGDRDGVRRAGWWGFALGVGFMALAGLLFWLAAAPLAGAFVPDRTSPVHGLAAAFLVWAALFQIVDGAQAVANGALRGLKDTAVPMALAIGGYWLVGLPAALWLGLATPMRGEGVWAGLALGLAVVAVFLVWRFEARSRRMPATVSPAARLA